MDVINAKSNTYPFVEVVIYSEILRTNCRMNQSSSHLATLCTVAVLDTFPNVRFWSSSSVVPVLASGLLFPMWDHNIYFDCGRVVYSLE